MDLERWYRMPVDLRARMLAHEIERNLREGYSLEHGRSEKKDRTNARDAMLSAWGVG